VKKEAEALAESQRVLARVEGQLRELATMADADADAEAGDCVIAVEQTVLGMGPGTVSEEMRARLVTGAMAERVGFLRRVLRDSCEAHGWKRERAPEEIVDDEEYDVCSKCEHVCGCTTEELMLFAEANKLSGKWSLEKAANRTAEAQQGICCARTSGSVVGAGDGQDIAGVPAT
jgi:hypothetical protein